MATDTVVSPAVLDWILQETRRGVAPGDLHGALIGAGWAPDVVNRMMEDALRRTGRVGTYSLSNPNSPAVAGGARQNQAVGGATQTNEDTGPQRTWIDIQGRTISVEVLSRDPYVAVVRGILDHSECAELRQIAGAKMTRSTTVNKETGQTEVIADRSSDGMFFLRGEHSFVSHLEERIADVMGYPIANGEGLQVLRYGTGGQYRPHHDYFDPSHSGSAVHLAHGGQRVATMVMYLNTPEAGGSTEFPSLGIKITPEEGSAVLFAYGPDANGIPDVRCLHAGCPVEKGEKWIATKWVRQGVFA